MRHLKSSKIICSLLICSMVLTSGAFIFADNGCELVDTMKSATLVRRGAEPTVDRHKHEGFKKVLDQLVEEGKLSRDKAEQIEKYVQQKKEEPRNNDKNDKTRMEKGHKHGLVNELVNAKIINDTEAEAIRSKFKEMRQKAFDEKLGTMVQKGIITKDQADKVKEYFEKEIEERKEQFKKLQNMTEGERRAYFREYKRKSVFDKLVDDGVLTKAQAQELKKVLKEGHKNKCKER